MNAFAWDLTKQILGRDVHRELVFEFGENWQSFVEKHGFELSYLDAVEGHGCNELAFRRAAA